MAVTVCAHCGGVVRKDGKAVVTPETSRNGGLATWRKHPDMRERMMRGREQSRIVRADVRKLKSHVYE